MAPLNLDELPNSTLAFILSKRVLPIKVPRPKPDFELINLLSNLNVNIIGIVCLVDRSNKKLDFGFPFNSLLKLDVKSWDKNDIPDWLDKIEITKPGSTGK